MDTVYFYDVLDAIQSKKRSYVSGKSGRRESSLSFKTGKEKSCESWIGFI